MSDIFDEKLKSNRKKNTLRMTIAGFVYVIASIVFPFLIRTHGYDPTCALPDLKFKLKNNFL